MDETKVVLIILGRKPVEIKKLAYTEQPLARKLEPVELTGYRPAWKVASEPEPGLKITWEPGEEDGS